MVSSKQSDDRVSFQQLSQQLDDVLVKLRQDDIDVDEALDLYKKGRQLADKLEKRLSAAEHRISQLKPKGK